LYCHRNLLFRTAKFSLQFFSFLLVEAFSIMAVDLYRVLVSGGEIVVFRVMGDSLHVGHYPPLPGGLIVKDVEFLF